MKKQIIAATLMASMVLAVGYSNGTNVKVTTHEGKVVEAKAESEYLEDEGELSLILYPIVTVENLEDVLYRRFTYIDVFDNSLRETVYSCENEYGQLQLQVHGFDKDKEKARLKDGNRDYIINSVSVYGKDIDVEDGIRVGASFSDVKRIMKDSPKTESNDYLEYAYSAYNMAFSFKNGVLESVTFTIH